MVSKDKFPQKSIEKQKEKKSAINMADFRREITELKTRKVNEEISEMFELLGVNPDDLTEEDAYMWNKANNYKPNSFIEIKFEEYLQGVKNSKNNSRIEFSSIIKQLFSVVRLREQQKDYEDSKKGI